MLISYDNRYYFLLAPRGTYPTSVLCYCYFKNMNKFFFSFNSLFIEFIWQTERLCEYTGHKFQQRFFARKCFISHTLILYLLFNMWSQKWSIDLMITIFSWRISSQAWSYENFITVDLYAGNFFIKWKYMWLKVLLHLFAVAFCIFNCFWSFNLNLFMKLIEEF